MHRLLQLLITQPELLVAHATAYAELAGADAQAAARNSQRKALWSAAFLCFASVAAALAGAAILIWATVPVDSIRLPWVLIATPAAPVLGALACLRKLRPGVPVVPFAKLRAQMTADRNMLQEANRP